MIDDIKITKAMERIEQLFYETNGKYCVSFSGGKDITVILALIKMCEELYTIPQTIQAMEDVKNGKNCKSRYTLSYLQ